MKRHLPGAAAALLIACGALVSACNVTPTAATANGAAISTASLNSQLGTLESTEYGACLLQLENPQVTAGQGDGGPGTYTMAFAGGVLEDQVEQLLTQQYASARGLSVSSADLTTAKSDLAATLDGEISSAVQQSTESGTTSACVSASGSDLPGAQLLQGLPSSVSAGLIRDQAYQEKLLADGANLSARALFNYYAANKSEFTTECVSRIVTSSQDAADQVVAQLNAGASFAALAKSSSIDTQTAANGGSLGCTFTEAEVDQALEQSNITVNRPTSPVQDSGSGQWFIYEVTSQTLVPLATAQPVVRREVLQTTANVTRVDKEIVAFAHRSDVSINPQYGTWDRLQIKPPIAPPPQFLLAGVSGAQSTSSQPPLTSVVPSGGASVGSGTGTAGSSSSPGGG